MNWSGSEAVMAVKKDTNPVRKWRPSPPELIAVFDQLMESVPDAEQRKMFGYPAAFVNGNMFAGLHQENMVLRLKEADRDALLAVKGAAPFEPMPGRAMKEYIAVPETFLEQPAELRKWLARSFAYAGSLPAKVKKKRGAGKSSEK